MHSNKLLSSDDIYEFLTTGHNQPTTRSTHIDSELFHPPDIPEAELDLLMAECSDFCEQVFNDIESKPGAKRSKLDSECSSKTSPTAITFGFAAEKTEEEIHQAKLCAVPAMTTKDTKFCVTILWNEWCSYRLTKYGHVICPLEELNTADLAHYLSSFIF